MKTHLRLLAPSTTEEDSGGSSAAATVELTDAEKARSTTELAAEFADLTDQMKKMAMEAGGLGARQKAIEKLLTERFQNEGCQSVNIHGRTVYLHRQLWAGKARQMHPETGEPMKDGKGNEIPVDTQAVVDALQECGGDWGALCYETFNTASLSAMVRDICTRDDQDMPVLPDTLKPVLRVSEVFSIRARKS